MWRAKRWRRYLSEHAHLQPGNPGILEDALLEFEDFPEYDVPYLVAEGVELPLA